MNCRCPQHFQDRVTRAGGMNRYGSPNFRLAWSQTETMRAGGVWPQDHFAGYREVYLANGSPYPPRHGYWMLLEWDGPETFGGEALWFYLHRDETSGLAQLGPYPHRGRYKIAVKLIWTSFDDGKLEIEPWPLNSSIIDMVIPVIQAAKKDSIERRRAVALADKAQAERKVNTAIEALVHDSHRIQLMPSQIEDRVRMMEKQWSNWLGSGRTLQPGFQQA